DNEVGIDLLRAGQVEIEAFAELDEKPDDAKWRQDLAAAGLAADGIEEVARDNFAITYRVAAPEGVAAVRDKLIKAELFRAEVREVHETRSARWGEISAYPECVAVKNQHIPWSEISAVWVTSTPPVPDDAWLLEAQVSPDRYWYALPLS